MSKNNIIRKIIIAAFWVLMWQILYMAVDEPLFLAGPWETAKCLVGLLVEGGTYAAVARTMGKILSGFVIALFLASLASFAAWRVSIVRETLAPFLAFLKSVPIASVIILLLAWFSSSGVSFFVSGFVAFPIVYFEMLSVLDNIDAGLLEMLCVYRVTGARSFRYVYLPAMCDGLMQSVRVAVGMGIRSGIAAELIGVPMRSLGEKLYKAKLYLEIDDLFAWTFIIVAAGYLCERIFSRLIGMLADRFGGTHG